VLSEDARQRLEPDGVLRAECGPDRLHRFDADTGEKPYDSTP
jgi:hypothetical protein